MAKQLNDIAIDCFDHISKGDREDLNDEDFSPIINKILGVYSMTISYQESIAFLCLSGHGLNSSTLLRSQLEAYLILHYLTSPKKDLSEIERRVELYSDWIIIRMFHNAKKSKTFDLFSVHPEHDSFVNNTELNYSIIKEKYSDNPKAFKELEQSQSFLKDKRKVAKEAGIEDLYLGIFSQTSASVHLADISDRMNEDDFGAEFYFNSPNTTMLMVGVSNMVLLQSIMSFIDFFEFPKPLKKKLFMKLDKAKKIIVKLK